MHAVIEFASRFWMDMVDRTDGPMTFRFFLQPTMAVIAALFDGIKDARAGRTPYAWLLTHASAGERRIAWRQGITATTRILLLGVVMDVIYQVRVFGGFKYPNETFVLAVVLGFVPYLLMRGPISRIATRWQHRHDAPPADKDRTP